MRCCGAASASGSAFGPHGVCYRGGACAGRSVPGLQAAGSCLNERGAVTAGVGFVAIAAGSGLMVHWEDVREQGWRRTHRTRCFHVALTRRGSRASCSLSGAARGEGLVGVALSWRAVGCGLRGGRDAGE
jgi:hypothetical protein